MWLSPTVEHINNDCCKAYQVANDNITSSFTTLFHELILQIDLLNSILSWWTFFNSLNETFQLEEMTVVVVDGGVHRQAHFFARHRVSPPPCEWQRLQDRDSLYNYWSQRQRQSEQLLVIKTKKVCTIFGHKDKDSMHNFWSQRQRQSARFLVIKTRRVCTIFSHNGKDSRHNFWS